MDSRRIVMNFTVPPSCEDIESITQSVWDSLPDGILRHCEELSFEIEEIVDDMTVRDLDLSDSFELLALYKSGKEISPGVEKKVANDDDVLVLYRRAILDMWCETEDDLEVTIRQAIVAELGRFFECSDDDVQEMLERCY